MKHTSKILALVLVVMTVIMSLSAITASAATETVTKVFEATELGTQAQGTYADGQEVVAGTDGFFTLVMSAKVKVDTSDKTFEDGYKSGIRVNWGGKSTSSTNLVKFTVPAAATVKVWWVCGGDGRTVALWDADGNSLGVSATTPVKNALYIDTFTASAAGTYAVAGPEGSNYIFKVEVSWTVELCDHEGGTATCKDQAICSKCEQPYGELTEDHNFVDGACTVCGTPDPNACQHTDMAPATCTAPTTCACGYTEGEALGHDMVVDAAVAPTCTEKGLTEGSHCSRCDEKVAQTEVAALGHTLTFVNTLPTVGTAGKTVADCATCGEHYDFGEVNVMTGGTYVLDAADLAGIAQYSLFDGEVKVVGGVFACHLSNKYRTDENAKSFTALSWTSTHRMNFGGASAFCNNGEGDAAVRNGGLKNFIQIVTTGETTITFAWGIGDDGREMAVYDMEGNLVAVTEEMGAKNDLAVSTLTVPAGSYLIGIDCSSAKSSGGNYIHKMIVDVELPHECVFSDPTCTEPGKCECGETSGEALGHDFAEGVCSVCGAEDPDYVPETPVDPDPVDPVDPEDPSEEPTEEPAPKLNFFQKIIAWFVELFNKIIGFFKK